jgi:AraC family transcriptional regulator of adaptative response/methylated-DNA-[protein]-cysteine methyltransferase
MSPKKFLQFLSLDHAKGLLRQSASVAEAAYETGFSGTGRLHDLFVTLEAMTPGEYRHGGAALAISYSLGKARLGNTWWLLRPRASASLCLLMMKN